MAGKTPLAVSRYLAEIGRTGGRSKRITPQERSANARRAALARWGRATTRDERQAANANRRRAGKPIWDVAEEIAAAIPKGELQQVPADGSRRLDAYLYNACKNVTLLETG